MNPGHDFSEKLSLFCSLLIKCFFSYAFSSQPPLSVFALFHSFVYFPMQYASFHHFFCVDDVRLRLALYTTLWFSFFFLSFPIQFLFQCLITATAGCSRRQVEISWQTSFSADKYLAWLRKSKRTFLFQANYFFYCFFFLTWVLWSDKRRCS